MYRQIVRDTDRGGGAAAIDWHACPPDRAMDRLESRRTGLTADEVARRRERYGANQLPEARGPGPFIVFLRQFKSPLIYLLLAASAVSLAIGELTDAIFIFGVLQVNALVGAFQEWRAQTGAEALSKLTRSTTVAVRDGRNRRLDSTELVPGDIVRLESGDRVPADIRLLESRELRADESLLTGESTPVPKDANATAADDAPTGDRPTMLHAGTVLLSGRALGIIVATGLDTEVGAIAKALRAGERQKAPLQIRLERLARQIAVLMTGAIIAIGAIQLLQGVPLLTVFLVAVALAVAAIPEGLPVAITVALSVGMNRMAARNVIVRALPAVEGLGACTVIATDKTGTLTCNELTVKRVWLPDGSEAEITGQGYYPEGEALIGGEAPRGDAAAALERLAESGALCNEATLEVDGETVRHLGDTVDVAFLVLARKLDGLREELPEARPGRGSVPYEPARRFAAAVNDEAGTGPVAHVKGAAETVLEMCAVDGDSRAAILDRAEAMAADGFRVLAVARGPVELDSAGDLAPGGLRQLAFLGLVGLIDPVRPEVPDAIATCRRTGVDVRMITGDHPATALAIARELGIAAEAADVVLGAELDGALSATARAAKIFARVDPAQKVDIVRALQDDGHFVAVTGDGVNDAPALERAHIGVAMGESGTDVARGAASLLLVDDNFASIVAGIEEGRIAYDNIRKVTMFLIGIGVGEIVLFTLALVAALPIPLYPVQLLWLNLVTNGVQDVALAFERGEPGVMRRRPRSPAEPLFDRRMILHTALGSAFVGFAGFAFYFWALSAGVPEVQARTELLLLMVLFGNAHVLNCRSERRSVLAVPFAANPWVMLSVVAALGLHFGAMYWPPFAAVLDVEPVTAASMAVVVPIAMGIIVLFEVYKFAIRRAGG